MVFLVLVINTIISRCKRHSLDSKSTSTIDVKGVTRGWFSLSFTWYIFSVSLGIKNCVAVVSLLEFHARHIYKISSCFLFIAILNLDLFSDSFSSMAQESGSASGRDARLSILTWLIEEVLLNTFTKARNWTGLIARTDLENFIIKYCFAIQVIS